MRAVLVDTGPLYALLDPGDKHHLRARGEFQALIGDRLELMVAFPNLLEAHTLILRRFGIRVAQKWLEETTDGFGLLNPNREDYLGAAHRLRRYPDQEITLADAVLAVIAGEIKAPVWSYDYHFDVMGVPLWR